MATRKVTIHDIAQKLGITASTVSRALNNNPRISTETKKLVHKTAKKMGYQPNIVASNLRTGKTKTIGLVVPRINRFFFADAIAGIECITNPAGYNLVICQSNESLENEVENISTLINSRVDGIIISVSVETTDGAHLQQIKDASIPFVQFDRTLEEVETHQVVNDNFNAAYNATTHLIEQGYKKIGHFAGNLHSNIYKERIAGYKKALKDNQMEVNEKFIFANTVTREDGMKTAKLILKMDDKPDAIFSAGDFSAIGALKIFKEAGLNIPKDMGLMGFANEAFTDLVEPPLSTVKQFGFEMGKTAAKILIEQIDGTETEDVSKHLTIKTKLCIRKSTMRTELF